MNQDYWRQSNALIGIGDSAKNYALLHNLYVRNDRWDKAVEMKNMIEFLNCAVSYVGKGFMLETIMDCDGEIIKEIHITCDNEIIGLPWKVD